jgi:hypothetical protein
MFIASQNYWKTPISKCFIYGLIDPRDNTLKYIGQTTQGINRLRDHLYESKYDINSNYKKFNWIKKLLKLNLVFDVIYFEYCNTKEELNEAESFYIEYYKTLGCSLLNHSSSQNLSGRPKMTEEEKIQHRKRMKEVMNKPEVKEKLRISHLGISPANKGKKSSPEKIFKIKEKNKLRSIKIKDSNGVIYNSFLEASKILDCTPTDIRRCILNPNKTFRGLKFQKVN